jgi:hypothetical protein
MSDAEIRFHESWLGMVQPIEGLVVSLPVLLDAQCMHRHSPSFHQAFLQVCPASSDAADATSVRHHITDLERFVATVLNWTPDLYDKGGALPSDLSLYVPEGKQTLLPTFALKRAGQAPDEDDPRAASSETPAAKAGAQYLALVWDVPDGLDLDKPETQTGPWEYPASAKFDRLLRQCRVSIGLLTNRREVRLVYAPHGESSGSIRFRVDDMASIGGRVILDAFVMLLSKHRFFVALPERQLPAILAESRKRQVNVTNQLADQVFDALQILLRGFEAAGERDTQYATLLRDALERGDDHIYGGLLTVLLRLVFVLYAEDRGLLPIEATFYADNLSVLALFDELQRDHGAYPDSMSRRFGAWPRLLALFRAIFLGCDHGDLHMPPRRGELFDPHVYPFLEGWGPAGSAPITMAEHRGMVAVPGVDDETVFRVLQKLLLLEGQHLSYRALDVEQIGSVYEALMGYHVQRVAASSVCLRPDRAKAIWVNTAEALEQKKAQRAKWLKEEVGLPKGNADKISKALDAAKSADDALLVLEGFRVRGTDTATTGRLVIQPGLERRRTSSHYTPRSLSAPIVEGTLAPLIKVMGDAPSSTRLLNLKVCDPAMGSGAFLVEACRYLSDQLVAAWTREGRLDKIADEHEDVVNHGRRLVAQRCLYGVDRNRFAVNLAKLSLWLVTLAKDAPFTFVDHALRHGDSLVGLDFEQINSFHWKPEAQLDLCRGALSGALDEAIDLRQQILALAAEAAPSATKEKYRLLQDAEDALAPVRLIGDLVVGAFFSSEKDKDRQKERDRRLRLVEVWLGSGGPPPNELLQLQEDIRGQLPVFHWMTEFPEVFYAERPDPLDRDQMNRVAYMDAFVGNPPFASREVVSSTYGTGYVFWLIKLHSTHGVTDTSAHFLRRADALLGAHGATGFICTHAIAEGESRLGGLAALLHRGSVIYGARRKFPWPGEAAVHVVMVWIAKGILAASSRYCVTLDDAPVPSINSKLQPGPERSEPTPLRSNADMAGKGLQTGGDGFFLSRAERDALVANDPKNTQRIFMFMGGNDVNTSPVLLSERYAINFGQVDLKSAEQWPQLLAIVRERVKPFREQMRDHAPGQKMKKYWWQFYSELPLSRTGTTSMHRCLAISRLSKHLAFCFLPTDRVLGETLRVFALDTFSAFAVLQSRVHGSWVTCTSSSRGHGGQYDVTKSFCTFPFPKLDPRAVIPVLEDIGGRLHEIRAQYMLETNRGLTQIYNMLKDPECTEAPIEELRQLHIEMDRAVLAAYGWSSIKVPPYTTPTTPEETKGLHDFQGQVTDRLFILNEERAKEEKIKGAGTTKKGKKARKATPQAQDQLALIDENKA